MGKVAATTAAPTSTTEPTKKRKKKGRPSLLDLQKRALEKQQLELQQQLQEQEQEEAAAGNSTRRSTRRNPNSDPTEFIDDEDDDDDERKEKKVKLVVRLPQSHFPRSSSANSGSCGSDSNNDDNPEADLAALKKPKIISVGSGDQIEKVSKATDTLHGSPLESGPTTPLPDKKLLVFILDRLQKKDTYGVFSEPVDPNELPDYHEIIEHPMDFGTVRSKLDERRYSNLEELEADVNLICSNAMQYNSSDTIYFRQARSIQELAKRDFENLRQEGDDGELQPKVVRRGRPPGKQTKKPLGRPPLDRVAPEFTSGATLASAAEENTPESNPYYLRRGPAMYRFNSGDGSQRSRNGENYSEWLTDWNDEFPASILRADLKYGKKHFVIDETRRDTYKQFHPSSYAHDHPSPLSSIGGDMKQLMAVGLHVEYGYARSLARFAVNLGPVAWKIASKKIERILPPGVKFGPGRVGENESPPLPSYFSSENPRSLHRFASNGHQVRPDIPSTSVVSSLPSKEEMIETDDRRVNSQNQSSMARNGVAGIRPGSPAILTQQNKTLLQHPGRDGFNGVFGYNNQIGMVGVGTSASKLGLEEGIMHSQMSARLAPNSEEHNKVAQSSSALHSGNVPESELITGVGYSEKTSRQVLSTNHHRHYSLPVQPDLNVGLQGPGSPSSGLRISSPQQPDLALQL